MKAARILCPGPSLARYEPDDFAGETFAVNRAAIRFCVDAWVACDYLLINQVADQVLGRPALLTSGLSVRHIKPAWPGKLGIFEALRESIAAVAPAVSANWGKYSFLAAIVCAAVRGATQIDCFGCDWEGVADFDGTAAGTCRTDDRWQDERKIFAMLSAAMATAGITVNRTRL